MAERKPPVSEARKEQEMGSALLRRWRASPPSHPGRRKPDQGRCREETQRVHANRERRRAGARWKSTGAAPRVRRSEIPSVPAREVEEIDARYIREPYSAPYREGLGRHRAQGFFPHVVAEVPGDQSGPGIIVFRCRSSALGSRRHV